MLALALRRGRLTVARVRGSYADRHAMTVNERRFALRPSTACAGLVALSVGQAPLEGRWTAEARLPEVTMELVLDVESRGEGLAARISVPAEHVLGLSVQEFEHADGDVSFLIPHPDHPMEFAGRIVEDLLDGALSMQGRELPLVFHHAGPIPAPPYREIEVSFPGAGREVHGALLLPPGDGPHRALALFHATSTGERDGLRFCADLAAREGLAALIYDRRPVPPDLATLSRRDFLAVLDDAEAAVRFLRARGDIDSARVGVGGLSQGAWISAVVATRVPEVAFVLALSPPGVPLHELDLFQSTQRLQAAGFRGEALTEAQTLLQDLHAAARGEPMDRTELQERLRRGRSAPWASVLALPDEVPPDGSAAQLLRWSAQDLDPDSFFERARVPVFLAFGERDERLPAARCAERLTERLARAGNTAIVLHRYPEANHALLPAPDLERHLAEWLRAR